MSERTQQFYTRFRRKNFGQIHRTNTPNNHATLSKKTLNSNMFQSQKTQRNPFMKKNTQNTKKNLPHYFNNKNTQISPDSSPQCPQMNNLSPNSNKGRITQSPRKNNLNGKYSNGIEKQNKTQNRGKKGGYFQLVFSPKKGQKQNDNSQGGKQAKIQTKGKKGVYSQLVFSPKKGMKQSNVKKEAESSESMNQRDYANISFSKNDKADTNQTKAMDKESDKSTHEKTLDQLKEEAKRDLFEKMGKTMSDKKKQEESQISEKIDNMEIDYSAERKGSQSNEHISSEDAENNNMTLSRTSPKKRGRDEDDFRKNKKRALLLAHALLDEQEELENKISSAVSAHFLSFENRLFERLSAHSSSPGRDTEKLADMEKQLEYFKLETKKLQATVKKRESLIQKLRKDIKVRDTALVNLKKNSEKEIQQLKEKLGTNNCFPILPFNFTFGIFSY